MARKVANSNNLQRQADTAAGWLRLELIDKNGKAYRLPKDLPLFDKFHPHAQMMNLAEKDSEFEFTFKGKVHIVDDTPKEDIEF